MITFFSSRAHAYTLQLFLTLAPEERPRFRHIVYEDLPRREVSPLGGTYIFSDLERLGPRLSEIALGVLNKLTSAGLPVRFLNHPTRSMRRYELLRTLHDNGSNDFDVYHLVGRRNPRRWPVFVREESEHRGPISSLLSNGDELERFEQEAVSSGALRQDRLVVEFCDTQDEHGLYRKYSAFCVGDAIIPRHVFFSNQWCIKEFDRLDPELVEEEHGYLEGNPHRAAIAALFAHARLQYGRIDYSLKGERIQVWEVNTNPVIVRPEHLQHPVRGDSHRVFVQRVRQAFAAIDS